MRVYTATEKSTGRTWMFQSRQTYGRQEFRFPLFNGAWAPTLSGAKKMAQVANRFRYDDEPALVIVEQ